MTVDVQGSVCVNNPKPVVHCKHAVFVAQSVTVVTVVGTDEQPQDFTTAAKRWASEAVSQPLASQGIRMSEDACFGVKDTGSLPS